ncbi:sugar ABC transporter permease [Paenibacillus lycopersici]|uniref:Sugar ABC transporter permease n=1 Tax=Paenibacillus lycopersici TaxID=2704462 RepID=A0A6C0G6P9_9BACL|nr:sugar ABC transporter permease [Paenibacillus lycopersici]QHT63540.1 sugar ABC transporter permease [Paenibacillus lycopersici]
MRSHQRTASILSVIIMGLGQLYNRQFVKGILLLCVEIMGGYYFVMRLPHAVWGLVTLGEVPTHLVKIGKRYKNVVGDHSVNLLIGGLVILILFALFVIVYVMNVRDAYRTGKQRDEGIAPSSFRASMSYVADRRFPQLLLTLPAISVLFLTIMPILMAVLLAFTNYSAPEHIPPAKLVDWVGFQTFIDLLSLKTWSHTFYGVFVWTVIWAVIATVTTYFGGLLVALLIDQKGIRFKGLWRSLFIIPYAIPQLISLLVMRNLFNGQFGPINQYLSYFGLGKVPWLTDPTWAKVTVILVNMWVGIPVSMVLILGVLTAIPKDMYEAAEVDGATAFQKLRVITLPFVFFATTPILITQFAGNINNFNVIFLLTNGDPVNGDYQYAGSTDLLVTWLYKLTLNNNKYNFASAIGIIIFVIVASLSIWSYRRSRSFKEEDMIQ